MAPGQSQSNPARTLNHEADVIPITAIETAIPGPTAVTTVQLRGGKIVVTVAVIVIVTAVVTTTKTAAALEAEARTTNVVVLDHVIAIATVTALPIGAAAVVNPVTDVPAEENAPIHAIVTVSTSTEITIVVTLAALRGIGMVTPRTMQQRAGPSRES